MNERQAERKLAPFLGNGHFSRIPGLWNCNFVDADDGNEERGVPLSSSPAARLRSVSEVKSERETKVQVIMVILDRCCRAIRFLNLC